MIFIDHYVYTNKLRNVHPMEKFVFTLTTMMACITSSSFPAPLLACILMSGLSIFRAGIPARILLRLMILPIAFLIVGEITIVFSWAQSVEGLIAYQAIGSYYLGVTAQDLNTAGHLFVKALGAVSCLYFLALTTPMLEMILVLRKLKVPGLMIELMSLIYRLIFVLWESVVTIHTAQASRLGYVSLRSSFRSASSMLFSLFIRSFQRSRAMSLALQARCYQGEIRFLEQKFTYRWQNYGLILLIEIILVISGYGGYMG